MPILGIQSSGGMKPSTPTIGTATDGGTGTTVSVAFTPSTYIGKGTISYTATSSPGSLTGTGSGSPITVSGLTAGTAYTFTVRGTTNYGVSSDNSAASNSVTPAVPTAFDSIATINGNGSSGTITFSSIPNTYKHLQIRGIARGTNASVQELVTLRLNSDTGANYADHRLFGDTIFANAVGNASQTSIYLSPTPAANTASNILGAFVIDIVDYSSTSKNKTTRHMIGRNNNGAFAEAIILGSGLWRSTSAVNSITLTIATGAFSTQSTFALYGIN